MLCLTKLLNKVLILNNKPGDGFHLDKFSKITY